MKVLREKVYLLPRGRALPFRIGREAWTVFLGPKILFRLIFLDLVSCLFKFIFLGSHVAENLYFWINLAYITEELNEKILNGRFSRPFCSRPFFYSNVEHWKMSNFWVSFAYDFCQGLYFWVSNATPPPRKF